MYKYFCKLCNRCHHRGKIYKKHLIHKREEGKKKQSAKNENITINFKNLRPIAKRQLRMLYKKMENSGNHEMYKNQIIELIKHEKMRK